MIAMASLATARTKSEANTSCLGALAASVEVLANVAKIERARLCRLTELPRRTAFLRRHYLTTGRRTEPRKWNNATTPAHNEQKRNVNSGKCHKRIGSPSFPYEWTSIDATVRPGNFPKHEIVGDLTRIAKRRLSFQEVWRQERGLKQSRGSWDRTEYELCRRMNQGKYRKVLTGYKYWQPIVE